MTQRCGTIHFIGETLYQGRSPVPHSFQKFSLIKPWLPVLSVFQLNS